MLAELEEALFIPLAATPLAIATTVAVVLTTASHESSWGGK